MNTKQKFDKYLIRALSIYYIKIVRRNFVRFLLNVNFGIL